MVELIRNVSFLLLFANRGRLVRFELEESSRSL